MNCPNCNHLITPGELICPACKARVAQMAQEEKLRDLAFEPVNKLKEFFSGKAFLVYSILLTVIAVAALADTFTFGQNVGGIFVTLNVTSVVVAIFALISAIAAWKIYGAKNEPIASREVSNLALYPSAQRIILIIGGIAFAVIFAVIGFIFIFSHDIITEQDAFRLAIAEAVKESGVEGIIGDVYSMIDEIAPVVGVLFIIISPVGLVIFILQAVMMKGLARYIKMLAGVVDGKEFDAEMKIPTGLLWTFGVIEAIRVVSTVFVAPISGAVSVALAGYLIINAIMLKNIANEMAAAKKHIESERGILFNITEASDRRLQEMDSAE